MLKPNGRISHANENFCVTTGRNQAALLGKPLADILPDREQELLRNDIMKAMEVGAPWDGPLKILREDGSIAWAQCTVIPVSASGSSKLINRIEKSAPVAISHIDFETDLERRFAHLVCLH